jgi:type IV pilus assembly protein PilZ
MNSKNAGSNTVPRPSVVQFTLKDLAGLAAAYMPILTNGGLFVPTSRDYRLGESVYVLLTLPDDPQRYPVAARVAWVTPANSTAGRARGVGIRFGRDEMSVALKLRIESILSNFVAVDNSSQTV